MECDPEDVIDLTGPCIANISTFSDDSFLDLSLASKITNMRAAHTEAVVDVEEIEDTPPTSRASSSTKPSSGTSTPSTEAYSDQDQADGFMDAGGPVTLIGMAGSDNGGNTADRPGGTMAGLGFGLGDWELADLCGAAAAGEDEELLSGGSGDVDLGGGEKQCNGGDHFEYDEHDDNHADEGDTFLEPGLLSKLVSQPPFGYKNNLQDQPSTSKAFLNPGEQALPLNYGRQKCVRPSPVKRSHNQECPSTSSADVAMAGINKNAASPSKRKKRSPEEIESAKCIALEKRNARLAVAELARETKAVERLKTHREKLLKHAQLQKQKSIRPNECLKHMKIILDASLPGAELLHDYLMAAAGEQTTAGDKEISIVLSEKLPVKNLIAWSRRVMENCVGTDGKLFDREYTVPQKQVAVYLPLDEFLTMVENRKKFPNDTSRTTLVSMLQRIFTKLKCADARVCFLVRDVGLYKRHLKTLRNRAHKRAVLDLDNSPGITDGKKPKRPPAAPKPLRDIRTIVEPGDIRNAVIHLEVQTGSSVVMVESEEQLGEVVWRMTKSVGESLHKAQREEKSSWIGFVSKSDVGCDFDCGPTGGSMDIGPNGQGGLRVWSAQLQQISSVSKIVAQSIVAHYGSPRTLIAAYDACADETACEKLLSELVIRRGAGITSSTSRLGPALSRKIYWAIASSDPELMLNTKN